MDKVILEKELFQKLFESAPDPIVIVDDKGIISLVNSEAFRKFGYTEEEMLDKPLEILLPERFRKDHVKYRSSYNDSPKTRPMGAGIELFARHKDGTEFPVEISLSPLKLSNSMVIISIIRDISYRKKIERDLKQKAEALEHSNLELERSNKELEHFAYIASHDLQEPLRSVAGSVQLLDKRLADKMDDVSKELVQFAVDGAKRMQELINDLLAYSRVTTKAKEPVKTSFDEIMTQVKTNLKSAIEETGAKVHASSLPTLTVDRHQVIQLIQNLVANSLKFRGEKTPEITVGAEKKENHWHFWVRDNGIGIDPKYFDRIFVVFKRLHTREEYPGTGIGLATCKKIVERHGGEIWVESKAGEGAAFHFTFPSEERAR